MSKLIRSKRTKSFLTPAGEWTTEVRKAAHFSSHTLAHAAMHHFQLRDVELYYLFLEDAVSRYDFTISL
jgi:hypothetical protein